jgi:hypothetical protein
MKHVPWLNDHKSVLGISFTGYPDDTFSSILLFSFQLPESGVSLISATPEELMYISMHGVHMNAEESPEQQRLELVINDVQFDNQQQNAAFPVVLAPTHVDIEDK